ncbi:NERD domain-containing protein [Priestia aryabhattai]|uniref:nuclease-related domain-containing protein n=1 Tax=Priestia aryabhattai TaxID=412384 RepID=UPI001C8D0150|nr:nuclease-related domain-containing protein [Priestia aryabhattai]MBX9970742.1 NERD domain-containing protein [Priestia aryabhattai]
MAILYITLIILLGVGCIYFYNQLRKKQKKYSDELTKAQTEAAVSMAAKEKVYKSEKKQVILQQEEYYNELIKKINQQHQLEMIKSNKYINSLEQFSRNRGEVLTHKILTALKANLILQGKIKEDEMIILGNIFVPYTFNDEVRTRQIDHLILMTTGIYVIETKYWRGKILYGLTTEKAKDFAFLLTSLFSNIQKDQEQTLVFVKNQNNDAEESKLEMKVLTYDNPGQQVTRTAIALKNYLEKHNKKYNFVTSILYFGYPSDEENNVTDYSSKSNPKCFSNKENLCAYFEKQINERKSKYTSRDLTEIKKIIEDINYFI